MYIPHPSDCDGQMPNLRFGTLVFLARVYVPKAILPLVIYWILASVCMNVIWESLRVFNA